MLFSHTSTPGTALPHLVVVRGLDLGAVVHAPHSFGSSAVQAGQRVEIGWEEDVGPAPWYVYGVVVDVSAIHLKEAKVWKQRCGMEVWNSVEGCGSVLQKAPWLLRYGRDRVLSSSGKRMLPPP